MLAHITGFMPYFYIPVPRGFETEDIHPFMSELNVRQGFLLPAFLEFTSSQSLVGGVTNIEFVQKRSLWGFKGDEYATFMKITVTEPKAVPRVRDECIHNRCITSFLLVSLSTRLRERRDQLQESILWTCHNL